MKGRLIRGKTQSYIMLSSQQKFKVLMSHLSIHAPIFPDDKAKLVEDHAAA